jgi:hypothetical protein
MDGETVQTESGKSHGKRRFRRRRKKRRSSDKSDDSSLRSRVAMGLAVFAAGAGVLALFLYGIFTGLRWLLSEMRW